MLARCPPERRTAFLAEVYEVARAPDPLWRDGVEPLAFDTFGLLLDGVLLTPRQQRPFTETGLFRARNLFTGARYGCPRSVQEFVLFPAVPEIVPFREQLLPRARRGSQCPICAALFFAKCNRNA